MRTILFAAILALAAPAYAEEPPSSPAAAGPSSLPPLGRPVKTGSRIQIKDQLQRLGLDTGPVDVDVRGRKHVLGLKF